MYPWLLLQEEDLRIRFEAIFHNPSSGDVATLDHDAAQAEQAAFSEVEHRLESLTMSPSLLLIDTVEQKLLRSIAVGEPIAAFVWLAGAAGRGTDSSVGNWRAYLRAVSNWWALRELGRTILQVDATAVWGHRFGRMLPTLIRYAWADRLICSHFITQLTSAHPNHQLPITIEEFDNVRLAAAGPSWLVEGQPGAALARALTLPEPEASQSFDRLLDSRARELFPFARTPDGYIAADPATVTFSLYPALHSLVARRMSTSVASALFERTVAACFADALRCEGLTGDLSVRIDAANPGETDIALRSVDGPVGIVGECKAKEPIKPLDNVGLHGQIGNPSGLIPQLHKRIDSLDRGKALLYNAESVAVQLPVYGIGVTLHSYGGSLSSSRALADVADDLDSRRIAISDLHSWMIISHTFDGIDDLRQYIHDRGELLNCGYESVDEVDLWAAAVSHNRKTLTQHARKANGVFGRSYYVELNHAHGTMRPNSPQRWQSSLWHQLKPIPLPTYGHFDVMR